MKQFLRCAPTKEINLETIQQVLSLRFPTCQTYLYKDQIRVKKNVLATAYVKVSQDENETCMTIDTILPIWVWLVIGWFFYLIANRGFVDEIYSVLERDLRSKYPDKFKCVPDTLAKLEWNKKTKILKILGWTRFVYICLFCYAGQIFMPLLMNLIFGESYYLNNLILTRNCISSLIWFLIGLVIFRVTNHSNVRISGVLLMIYALVNAALTVLSFISKLPGEIAMQWTVQIIVNALLFSAGYMINKGTKNGICRHLYISIAIATITSILYIVVLWGCLDYWGLLEQGLYEMASTRLLITNVWSWLFFYPSAFMFSRALSKMKDYPIYMVCKHS